MGASMQLQPYRRFRSTSDEPLVPSGGPGKHDAAAAAASRSGIFPLGLERIL